MPVSLSVKPTNLKGSTLLTGFHGIGETGYIAISYLIHALQGRRIGFVSVERPPPFVATSHDGLITPFEVYKCGRFVLVKLEFSPHRTEEAEFAKALANWAIDQRFRDAVLVGGLDSNLKNGREKIRIVPTEAYLPKSKFFNGPTLEPGLFVYGPLAVMLSAFEMNSFPAVAVLAYATPNRADPAAAAIAIRSICKAYKLQVDVRDLVHDAKEIEGELTRRLEETRKSLHGMYG